MWRENEIVVFVGGTGWTLDLCRYVLICCREGSECIPLICIYNVGRESPIIQPMCYFFSIRLLYRPFIDRAVDIGSFLRVQSYCRSGFRTFRVPRKCFPLRVHTAASNACAVYFPSLCDHRMLEIISIPSLRRTQSTPQPSFVRLVDFRVPSASHKTSATHGEIWGRIFHMSPVGAACECHYTEQILMDQSDGMIIDCRVVCLCTKMTIRSILWKYWPRTWEKRPLNYQNKCKSFQINSNQLVLFQINYEQGCIG